MTDQPPMPPPIPRLEAVRPRDERYAAGSSQPPDPRQRRSQQLSVEQPRKSPARQVEPARRRGGWLRLLAWSVGGLVVVIGGVVALATVFLPVGLIRDELVREVKARTGRQLVVTGATSLSLWPSLAVSMGDVSLSGPPGMAGPPLVKMRRLSARAAVLPLLQRQIVIEEVVLADPVLELQVDAQGRRNWDFADLAVAPRVQFAQAKTPGVTRDTLPADLQDFVKNSSPNSSQGKPAPASAASDIAIGDINIENGTIRYRDARSGTAQDLTAINARVAAKSLQSPAEAKGTLVLRGDKVAFDARLSTPRTLMEQRPARLVLALTTPRASSHYDGTLGLAQGPALEGALKLDTASLRSLAGWLGAALPDTGGLAAMSFKGDVKTGPTWLAVSNGELRLDDTTASGTVNVDLVAGRPHIKANIKVSALDLNHYLGGGTGAQPAPAHPAPPAAAGAGSIEDLIRKSDGPPVATKGPKVKGSVQHSGWSEEPFNAVALGLADVDARIALAGLVYRQVKLGNTQLALALKSRATIG